MRNFNINYKPAKIYNNSKKLETKYKKLSEINSSTIVLLAITTTAKADDNILALADIYSTHEMIDNDFDSLYLPCVASKKTCIVTQNKLMIKIDGKLDKIHLVLWKSYHSASFISKTYATILLNGKTQKHWSVYLCLKDKFVNTF